MNNQNYEKELFQVNKKEWIRLKFNRAKNWTINYCKQNPEVVVAIITTAGGLAWKGFKAHRQTVKMNELQALKDQYIYDRSLGHYWKLNRAPKPAEWAEIARRKKDLGQDYYTILTDLRLL